MELEEILKKYIEVKKLLESNQLLVAAGLVDSNEKEDLKEADELLAETTKADAELLAKTTKADADLLAKETKMAANQLRESNEKSVKWMTWLTVAMLLVGLMQIVITVIPFIK